MRWDPRAVDPQWPFDLFATRVSLETGRTAHLVADMQAADMAVAPDSDLGQRYPAIRAHWNAAGEVALKLRSVVAGEALLR